MSKSGILLTLVLLIAIPYRLTVALESLEKHDNHDNRRSDLATTIANNRREIVKGEETLRLAVRGGDSSWTPERLRKRSDLSSGTTKMTAKNEQRDRKIPRSLTKKNIAQPGCCG